MNSDSIGPPKQFGKSLHDHDTRGTPVRRISGPPAAQERDCDSRSARDRKDRGEFPVWLAGCDVIIYPMSIAHR